MNTSQTHAYLRPEESDIPAIARLWSDAFAGPLLDSEEWGRRHGPANLRMMRRAGEAPEAALVVIPMGQYFGGRSVPMVGIAGVAVGLASRGKGLAKEMMTHCVRELAEQGVALSALYASTRPLYRQVGYESAGVRNEYGVPVGKLEKFHDAVPLKELTLADEPAMRVCHAEWARSKSGVLDRGAHCWGRVWKFREEEYRVFGVWGSGGRLEAYVAVHQRRKPELGKHDVAVSDMVGLTPRGWRSISTFLAGFGTMGERVSFFAGETHPLGMLMPHHWCEVRLNEAWMLRMIDVEAALRGRGYGAHVRCVLALEVEDDIVAKNAGGWRLRVEGGKAEVERHHGSGAVEGRLRTGVRGLAAMYSGYLSAHDAAGMGLCEGSEEVLGAASAVFAGERPWMCDFF